MANLTMKESFSQTEKPSGTNRLALFRVINDLILVAFILFLISPVIQTDIAKIVLAAILGILASNLLGFTLINRGRVFTGLVVVVYGLIIGLFLASIFIQGLGGITFLIIILFTLISVSNTFPPKRLVAPITISIILGIGSFLIDINLGASGYRIPIPSNLSPLLLVMAFFVLIIFGSTIQRQFSTYSLRTKIIISFVIVSVISQGILGFLNNRRMNSVLIEEANEALFAAASQTETTLNNYIQTNLESISTEGQIPIFDEFIQTTPESDNYPRVKEEAVATLNALHGKNPDFITSYALLGIDGSILIDTDPNGINQKEGEYQYFNQVLHSNAPQMSPVEFSPISQDAHIYFGAPILNSHEEIQGVIRVKYDANILQEMLSFSKDIIGKDSFGVLFDENLIHLAHGSAPETLYTTVMPLEANVLERLVDERRLPNISPEEIFLTLPELAENLYRAQSHEDSVVYFDAVDIATGDRLNQVVVIDMESPPWLLAFFQPKDIFLKPVENLINSSVLFGLISILGAVLIAIGFTQVLTLPINQLTKSANEISHGNLDARIEVTTEDEIGDLSITFNNMTDQLQHLIENLEDQVAERTRDLQNRAAKLQAAAEIARDATSETELDDLLYRAATLISDRFELYHVGIYLVDKREEFAVLAAGNDKLSENLIENEHNYLISSDSNVSYVCSVGEPRLAPNDDDDIQISRHPLLQKTAAQMVLPIKTGQQILGAIDCHSINPNGLRQEDVPIFQTMIDQLAIAIEKTEYRGEIEETLKELETAYGIYTQESWKRFIQDKGTITGYSYNQKSLVPVSNPPPEVIEAWSKGEATYHIEEKKDSDDGASTVAIPMKIRGEVTGVLNIEFNAHQVPTEIDQFIQEVANRLSLILENARLVDAAQRRGSRDLVTSEISNKIRQSLDMDSVLRVAVKEIGESLDLAEVEVRIGDAYQEIGHDSNGKSDKSDRETELEDG